jgi:hypothetical protein
MPIWERIKALFALKSDTRKRVAAVRELAIQCLGDGILTDEELSSILAEQRRQGLSDDDLRFFRTELFQRACDAAGADRRLTPPEEESLNRLMQRFSIDTNSSSIQRSARDLPKFRLLYEIDQGNLPVLQLPGIVLRGGEQAHAAVRASLLEERVIRKTYQGGSQGVSFRIARGVSYRVGGHRGQIKTETGIVPVSTGVLALTSKRVVFHGDRKSLNATWNKVGSAELHNNGITLSLSTRGEPARLRFEGEGDSEIFGAVFHRLLATSPE